MKRSVVSAAGMTVVLVALLVPGPAAAAEPQRFDPVNVRRPHPGLRSSLAVRNGNRTVDVAVQLKGQPVAVRQGAALAEGRSLSTSRKRELRRTLGGRQRVVAARLRGLGAKIQYTYTDVFNGFRIRVKAKNVNKIARLPNVEAVLTVPRHAIDNANTVAYLGADRTWGQTGRTGQGVKIAIIDTGLNYYHFDFAGKGNAAWRDDDPTKREPGTFPTNKVVGGHDFVGDSYDADSQPVPHPDPDPLDCKAKDAESVQHGTHVAGTAAGTGVTTSGGTYTGPYHGDTLDDTDFRIAPGVAPKAKLLAYRVFGCEGSTRVVVDAIERAVQDGADVINMSLGSSFGDAGSLDAIAADNASLAGVVVVASSGNSGASAYLTGSPAAATRAISVAAMDARPTSNGFGGIADFSSAGPRRTDDAVKPDITAPGVSVFSADGGTTGQGKSLSGTSMASPAIAGVAALIKQAHPGWAPRDIKAAIVGTASAGGVSPFDLRMAGSGLAQPRRAVDTVAFAYTDPGSSSITFGLKQAGNRPGTTTSFSETQKLAIRNTSSRSIRYDLSNSFNGDSRGLKVTISPSSVTVPAKSKKTIAVKVTLAESAVGALPAAVPNHAPKLSVDGFGNFYTPVTTVRGVILANPRGSGAGVYTLRVPWLVAPRGTSEIRQVDNTRTDWTTNGTRRDATIKFRNFGLHKGWVDVYAWGLTDGRDGVGEIDLRAAGVQSLPTEVCTGVPDSSDRCLVFAINTWQRWSNAAANEFFVAVDVNKDGEADYVIDAVDDGLVFLGDFNGLMDALVIDLSSGDLVGGFDAVVAANGTTLLLPALASDFGLDKGGPAAFDYWVESYTLAAESLQFDIMLTGDSGADARPNARFDAFKSSLSTGYFKSLGANKTATVPLRVNTTNYHSNRGQKGWLVVTMDDTNGAQQADMVSVGELP